LFRASQASLKLNNACRLNKWVVNSCSQYKVPTTIHRKAQTPINFELHSISAPFVGRKGQLNFLDHPVIIYIATEMAKTIATAARNSRIIDSTLDNIIQWCGAHIHSDNYAKSS